MYETKHERDDNDDDHDDNYQHFTCFCMVVYEKTGVIDEIL